MWDREIDRELARGLRAVADPSRAPGMAAYMKDVAPFLGVATAERRRVVSGVLRAHPQPMASALCAVVDRLLARPHREFHYAAIEILGKHWVVLPGEERSRWMSRVITTKPWWDTVDLAGTHVVTPMTVADPGLVAVMWEWLRSDDRWLVRAALQHQRGRKRATDVARLVEMCDEQANCPDFFVAKAVGWALRDLAWIDTAACEAFLTAHPAMAFVARREAERGLTAARAPGARRPGLA